MKTRTCYETHKNCNGSTCNHATSRHTPGPWTINGTAIEGGDHPTSIIGWVNDDPDTCDRAEQTNNARLIAAAPDLLATCQLACVRLEGGTKAERDFNAGIASQLRAAIARAKGEA